MIVKIKRYLFIALFLVATDFAMAQKDPEIAHYWMTETSFNPAAAGKGSLLNVSALYNMTYAGFDNSPKTIYASGDMPIRLMKSSHGVGARFVSDNIGIFSHTNLSLQYAYQRKMFGGTMAFGINIGMYSEKIKADDIDLENSDDYAFPSTDANGTALDMGVGVYYTRKDFYAGLSVAHLNSPSVEIGERQSFNVKSAYYFTAGYNIRLKNPFLSIQPTMLARATGNTYRVDLTGRLTYQRDKKMLYVGGGFNPINSATIMIGGNFHGVCLGYSYEIYTSKISLGNGSHEFIVSYQTEIDLGKKGKNLHKSVRLL